MDKMKIKLLEDVIEKLHLLPESMEEVKEGPCSECGKEPCECEGKEEEGGEKIIEKVIVKKKAPLPEDESEE